MTKKITLTNGKIYNSLKRVQELSNKAIPTMQLMNSIRGIKAFNETFKVIDEARVVLLKKFGEQSKENSESYTVPTKNIEKYTKEVTELMSLESTFKVYPLKLTPNFPEVLPSLVIALDFMFEDLDEDKPKEKPAKK